MDIWEQRYIEQTATCVRFAEQRNDLLVALYACVGALEFYEEVDNIKGPAMLALMAARGLLNQEWVKTVESL